MFIIKLGGTNGSGKTSLARALISGMNEQPKRYFNERGSKVEAYVGKHGLRTWAVLGSYENVCGGMDTISDKHQRQHLVRDYAENRAVDVTFFEGLITGKTYGAFGTMSEEPKHRGRWLYAYMDTPFDVCVERVMARRLAAENTQPFDPERTMRPTHKAVESTMQRARTVGHPVILVNHKAPPEVAAAELVKLTHELIKKG